LRRLKRTSLILLAIVLIISGISCTGNGSTQETTSQDKTKISGSVKVGDVAPDFEMRNQAQLKVSLSEFKGKKNVVVVFYPADFTPV